MVFDSLRRNPVSSFQSSKSRGNLDFIPIYSIFFDNLTFRRHSISVGDDVEWDIFGTFVLRLDRGVSEWLDRRPGIDRDPSRDMKLLKLSLYSFGTRGSWNLWVEMKEVPDGGLLSLVLLELFFQIDETLWTTLQLSFNFDLVTYKNLTLYVLFLLFRHDESYHIYRSYFFLLFKSI